MMSWRASAPANTAGVWNGRPASESTTRNHRATVSPASRPPTAPCPIRSLMAGLIVPSARTTRTQYHAGPRARNRRRRGLWRSLRDFPFWYLMTGDATTPELPPGLLEDYLEGMRGQLGALARVADHLDADGGDQEALEQLRRETHKIHGSAGSFGFWNASRLAAGTEVTAKDWLSRPADTDVERPGLDGYSIFEALGRERPGVYRVVFTTVHGDEGEQLRGLEAGALDYLVKPISLRVALEKIRRWVGR